MSLPDSNTEWSIEDLSYAENELAKEYPYISFAVVRMVISTAKVEVSPDEGRVKLLNVARKSMAR